MDVVHVIETGVVAALGTAAVLAAFRSPFAAYCVFLATLPFEGVLVIRGAFTILPSYLALLLLFGVCAIRARSAQIRGTLWSPLNAFVLVYVGICVLSTLMTIIAPPPVVSGGTQLLSWRAGEYRPVFQIGLLLFSCTAYFATLYFCSTAQQLRIASTILIVSTGLVALYALYQAAGVWFRAPLVGPYAAGLYETPGSLRPNGTFVEPMHLGHFLLFGFPLALSLYLQHDRLADPERRLFSSPLLPALGTMLVALFLTIARGAWVGFFFSSGFLVFMVRGRGVMRIGVLSGLVVLAASLAFVSTDALQSVTISVANRLSLSAASLAGEQRLWYFRMLLELFREHPVLGVGYGNYGLYQVSAFDLYGIAGAYGIYWQALVETGVMGTAALMAMLGAVLWFAFCAWLRHPSSQWRPYLAGLFASLLGLLAAHLFMGDRFSLYTWVAFGIAMAVVRLAEQESRT